MGLFSVLTLVAVVWLSLKVGHVALRCFGRLIPLTLLGIAAVIGGLALFGTESDEGTQVNVGPWKISGSMDWDDELPQVDLGRIRSEVREHIRERMLDHRASENDQHAKFPRWALVSLGAILIISGSLLASRQRTRPGVLKALTVVGAAASCFALFSFFNASPRHIAHRPDRIVKSAPSDIDDEAIVASSTPVPPMAKPAQKQKQKTPRAKRPSVRSTRPQAVEDLHAELPARAGEIPVHEELAKADAVAQSVPVALPEKQLVVAAPVVQQVVTSTDPAPIAKAAESTLSESAAPAVATVQGEAPQPIEPPPVPPVPSPPVVASVEQASPPPAAPPVDAPAQQTTKAPAVQSAPIRSTKKRPDWVETAGRLDGPIYRTSVKSGLWVDVPECQRALDQTIRREADHYINEYLGSPEAASTIRVPLEYLRQHVVKAEFPEVVTVSVGPMQQIHALLEFDDAARSDFHSRWRDAVLTNRLWYIGSGTGLVLAMLGIFYSYLTLDLRTGGSHKNQLRLAATLVALIAAVGVLLVND